MSDIQVGLVRVAEVRFHQHNVRHDLGDLRSLTASIKRFGVMQPIVVEKQGSTLRLRAGHRRLAAARLAGLARVPAVIHPEALDDDEWLIHAVQENVMRTGIDDADRRRTIKALLELGCTWGGVAEAFGVSQTAVRKWGADPVPGQAVEKKAMRSSVRRSTLRSFAAEWRVEATARPITVDQLLDALDTMANTGRLEHPPTESTEEQAGAA